MLEWSLLTMQAENVLPSLVPFQQPPLFNPQRNAPDAVKQKEQKIKPLKKMLMHHPGAFMRPRF